MITNFWHKPSSRFIWNRYWYRQLRTQLKPFNWYDMVKGKEGARKHGLLTVTTYFRSETDKECGRQSLSWFLPDIKKDDTGGVCKQPKKSTQRPSAEEPPSSKNKEHSISFYGRRVFERNTLIWMGPFQEKRLADSAWWSFCYLQSSSVNQ